MVFKVLQGYVMNIHSYSHDGEVYVAVTTLFSKQQVHFDEFSGMMNVLFT